MNVLIYNNLNLIKMIPNETPDENKPCFEIKTHVCLYQNYNNNSKNLNIAVNCHQLTIQKML